ncbi:MAG: DUF5011 domain-containing protein [Lachnospiraceae bacterium]|nr:DUF5011 domain-containing protein [Lachnospiraceae bacterium]
MTKKKLTKICFAVFVASLLLSVAFWFIQINSLDRVGPEIKMDKKTLTVNIKADEEDFLKGVTAVDDKDGDVTDSLVVEKVSNFLEDGKRLVTYAAVDKSTNVTRATRVVKYKNYKSPRFDLEEPLVFASTSQNNVDITENLKVKDKIDGDISDQIKLFAEDTVALYESGNYKVSFRVTNSAGDTITLPATIEVYNSDRKSERPFIYLDKYIVYTKKGHELNPSKYIDKVAVGTGYDIDPDDITSEISTSKVTYDDDDVNYDKRGTYEITYKVKEDSHVGTVRLIVVVY